MPHPDDIQSNLNMQFEKMDEMYANDDLRVFGIVNEGREGPVCIFNSSLF